MCHLLLVLPLLGIGVFWVMPFYVALLTYSVILAISAVLYLSILRAMHRPVQIGPEQILNGIGEVISAEGRRLQVRMDSQMWRAVADVPLQVGSRVRIISRDGLTLHVVPADDQDRITAAHG